MNHLRVSDCLCYVHNQRHGGDKFASRSNKLVFIGYPFGQNGWKVYNLDSGVISTSRDVIFCENEFPFAGDLSNLMPSTYTSALSRPRSSCNNEFFDCDEFFDQPLTNSSLLPDQIVNPVNTIVESDHAASSSSCTNNESDSPSSDSSHDSMIATPTYENSESPPETITHLPISSSLASPNMSSIPSLVLDSP